MLPAAALGTDQLQVALQTPLVLSVNQAFISLRQDLCAMKLGIQPGDHEQNTSKKLVQALQQNHSINLAYVYKYSIHHYCLKAVAGVDYLQLAKNIQKLDDLSTAFHGKRNRRTGI